MASIGSLDDMGHRCSWTMDLEIALNSSVGPNSMLAPDGSNNLSGEDGSCDCMALDTTKASGYGQSLGLLCDFGGNTILRLQHRPWPH